jgi:GNAT superfamily N-acetyltransferase
MIYREQTPADVPMAFLIRAAARENPMPLISGLKFLGITVEGEARKLATTHKGFVCEDDGLVIGFVIADGSTGELWVLSVWPEYEGKGIGRQAHDSRAGLALQQRVGKTLAHHRGKTVPSADPLPKAWLEDHWD